MSKGRTKTGHRDLWDHSGRDQSHKESSPGWLSSEKEAHDYSIAVHREWARKQTDRQTDRENSNSKTLILKDGSVRSFWTYLTASACYTTNTNKQDYTTNMYDKHE